MIERALYRMALPLGLAGFRAYARFDEKAAFAFKVREELFARLRGDAAGLSKGKRVLIHFSSVGEYLQARPIARLIRQQYPQFNLVMTFFSTSMERVFKNGNLDAELADYLPFDRKKDMEKLLDLLKPELIIFSCYDLWPNLIWLAKARGIKVSLINANLAENSRKTHPLVRWWFRRLYRELDLILAASEEDRKGLAGLGLDESLIVVTGNARYEETMNRIRGIAPDDPALKELRGWKRGPCVVMGSTWPEDEEVIVPALQRLWREGKNLQVIMAPHEAGARRLEALKERFFLIGVKPLFLWEFVTKRQGVSADTNVIIIDRTGLLYKLYQLGEAAFVGGSFKKEVHNVMEPAGFSIPVLFGPQIRNSLEALKLAERKGGFVVEDSDQLYERLKGLLENEDARQAAGKQAYQMVMENQGAGAAIVKLLEEKFPEIFERKPGGAAP